MKTAKLAGFNECIVGQYKSVFVAVALQMIPIVIHDPSVWVISMTDEGRTHCDL